MSAYTYAEHNALIRAAAERYQERFAVNPGDFATVRQEYRLPLEATPMFPLLCSTHMQRDGVEL